MNIFGKGLMMAVAAMASLTAVAPAAQAHDGWRGGREYRNDRCYYRRNWRGNRCWNEWRYDRYRHRDVKVRICR